MSFTPIEHTGNFRIKNIATGLYLVMPVSAWRHECKPEWTEIPECAFRFNKSQAADQQNFLVWNCKIQTKQELSKHKEIL